MKKWGKKMKKGKTLKTFVTLITLCVLLLSISGCSQSDEIKGTWLTCPTFPDEAKVVEFKNDTEKDIVTHVRELDGKLRFEIRRQPLKGSELQKPDDVESFIELRVNNEKIDQEAKESNLDSISVNTDADQLVEFYKYPCVTAEYKTGADEKTRQNVALFIFTDVYCFEVNISVAEDFASDYGNHIMRWLSGLKFVENASVDAAGK